MKSASSPGWPFVARGTSESVVLSHWAQNRGGHHGESGQSGVADVDRELVLSARACTAADLLQHIIRPGRAGERSVVPDDGSRWTVESLDEYPAESWGSSRKCSSAKTRCANVDNSSTSWLRKTWTEVRRCPVSERLGRASSLDGMLTREPSWPIGSTGDERRMARTVGRWC